MTKRVIVTLLLVVSWSVWAAEFVQSITIETDGQGKAVAKVPLAEVQLADDVLKVEVSCNNGLDCSRLDALLIAPGATNGIAKQLSGSGAQRTLLIPKAEVSQGKWRLKLKYNGIDLAGGEFSITAGGAPDTAGPNHNDARNPTQPLFDLIAYPCSVSVAGVSYDLSGNRATVVVNPLGQVLSSKIDAFDENDTLVVQVIANRRLRGRLQVQRSSAFRDRTEIRILGEGATRDQIKLQAGEQDTCEVLTFELSDFAPGRAEVQLSVLSDDLRSTKVGSFEFFVDPLYVGMFSAGPIWTSAIDPGIGLAKVDSQSVITAKNDTDHDLRYGAFFTPFIWGRRDVEKTRAWYRENGKRYPFWQHVNPSIGFLFDKVSENALVGLSVDLPRGVVVIAGKHFRKVKQLDARSDLSLGDPFTGAESDIPLVEDWSDDTFVAVTLDLRILVRMLRTVVSSGSK